MKKVIFEIKNELKIKVDDKPIKELVQKLKNQKLDAVIEIGGSYAKKTYLSNDFDVDIFVRFKEDKEVSERLESAIKTITKKYLKVHGSRDYFQLKYKGINFEIVPVFYINKIEEAHNTTDCSPLHVHWIKKQIQKNPKLVDEIKVGKLFLKANKLYGAESYLNGFSGHVLDVLTVYYGSFENLIKNAKDWNKKIIIDINKNYESEKELCKAINKSKRAGPLIVVDPIDKKRNAAAALGNEKFEDFVIICKEFYENPNNSFFKIKKLKESKLKKPYLKIVVVPEKGKSIDVAGTKAFRLIRYFKQILKNRGYSSELIFEWEKKKDIFGYFLLNKKELNEKVIIKMGPPISQKKDCEKFKEKNPINHIKNNRLYSKIKKKSVANLIKELKNDDYQKGRVEKIKSIELKK